MRLSRSSISRQNSIAPTTPTTQSIAALDSFGNISSISFPSMIWYPQDRSLTSLTLLTSDSVKMGVPSGWAICDGQNGTPDLRGRFVLMAQDTKNDAYYSSIHPIGQVIFLQSIKCLSIIITVDI